MNTGKWHTGKFLRPWTLDGRTNTRRSAVARVASIILQIKVKPNARASSLVRSAEGSWSAQLKAPPVDGKANQELIALVAQHFGCARSAVFIKSGASGKLKLVQVVT